MYQHQRWILPSLSLFAAITVNLQNYNYLLLPSSDLKGFIINRLTILEDRIYLSSLHCHTIKIQCRWVIGRLEVTGFE